MNVKISPSGTPPLRRRSAKGDRTASFKSKFPRKPDAFAGESKKIRRRVDLEKRAVCGKSLSEGMLPINLIFLVCISCGRNNLGNKSNHSATLSMKKCASHGHFESKPWSRACSGRNVTCLSQG